MKEEYDILLEKITKIKNKYRQTAKLLTDFLDQII